MALPDILSSVETPEPTAKPLAVTITKRTASVPRNGTASVTIKMTKKAIGSRTTRGTWPIYISCSLDDRQGDAETEFTVR